MYIFMLECGHWIREVTVSRYNNYSYKNKMKTTCSECKKLSLILRAGNLKE